MKQVLYVSIIYIMVLSACSRLYRPQTTFDHQKSPPPPDYASLEAWAAHPSKVDKADLVPNTNFQNRQDQAQVDVFFLHPTSYLGEKRDERAWNVAIEDVRTNKTTDNGAIQYQATVFNGICRVFAPRYRQAHYASFFPKEDDKAAAEKALMLAYSDALAAFQHYLKYENKGRPFILAGHSQGALHIKRILKNEVEGKPLESLLVAAYIVGWPVEKGYFTTLKPCETPEQTDCFCTWRTYNRDYALKHAAEPNVICTNPLLWSTTPRQYAPKSANAGGVVRPFDVVLSGITDAEVHNGYLMAAKPKFKGSIFFRRKNYHVGDINLYYVNLRDNVALRTKYFLERK